MELKTMPLVAAGVIGLAALLHATPVLAAPTCETCDAWYAECQSNPNSSACSMWNSLCHFCPPPAGVRGTPTPTVMRKDAVARTDRVLKVGKAHAVAAR